LKPHPQSSSSFCAFSQPIPQWPFDGDGASTRDEPALLRTDEKHATALVALDISVAFDTINQDVLIDPLPATRLAVRNFRVRDAVSRCLRLRSYLSDKKQFVKLGAP